MDNENSKRRKSLSTLYIFALIAGIAVLLLPATRWIATSQIDANFALLGSRTNDWLRYEMGVKDDRQVNVEAIRQTIAASAASESSDYGLQFAAILMTPTAPDGEAKPIDDLLTRLFDLSQNFRALPRAKADYLRQAARNMSIGQNQRQELVSDYLPTTPAKPSTSRPAVDRAQVLHTMQGVAMEGTKSEPDNAFFPLMEAVVLFALEQGDMALERLHAAAQCSRYEDYAMEEALDLNRLSEKAFGRQSVIVDVTQGASVLLPHYAHIRGAMRLAVVFAIEQDADNDAPASLDVREDILKVGYLMRKQARLLIGNIVGSSIEEIAGARPGGIPQVARPQTPKTSTSEERDAARLSRFTAYLDVQGRSDLTQFVRKEYAAKTQIKVINEKASDLTAFGGKDTFLLGLWHILGAVMLANVFWLILFGGLAAFLLKRKMSSMRPAMLILACWFGIAVFYSWYNAPHQSAYGTAITILYNLSSETNSLGDTTAAMRVASLLSVTIPFSVAMVACLMSAFSRVPVSLGLLRGLRGLCLPAAAVLVLLWVPVLTMTVSKENALRADYQGYLQHEGKHLAGLAKMPFPE